MIFSSDRFVIQSRKTNLLDKFTYSDKFIYILITIYLYADSDIQKHNFSNTIYIIA